jgi:ribosomal biogenesis protein LAS1
MAQSNRSPHRFITGFTDTQLDLRRSHPPWLSSSPITDPTTFLTFPPHLLETRHNIVHRHLPPLFVLKKAALQSLDWLWEWYWSRLDTALSYPYTPADGGSNQNPAMRNNSNGNPANVGESKDKQVPTILKSYLRQRKSELKARPSKKSSSPSSSAAAQTALSTLSSSLPITDTTPTPTQTNKLLLDALIKDRSILPATRALGSSTSTNNMAGAFLIWDPLLVQLSSSSSSFLPSFLDAALEVVSPAPAHQTVKEAFVEWILHILTAPAFRDSESGAGQRKLIEYTLQSALSRAGTWDLRLAERVLGECGDDGVVDTWRAVLDAAVAEGEGQGGDAMDVGMEEVVPVVGPTSSEKKEEDGGKVGTEQLQGKLRGPQKYVGLWRPQAIGVLPVGWEVDE